MAWKTPGGHYVPEGSRVVFLREDKTPDFKFTGTVVECLMVNDDDDGEIRIAWDNGSAGPRKASSGGSKIWYYPMWVEIIDKINALDKLAGHL
jgi:hypothetical protein